MERSDSPKGEKPNQDEDEQWFAYLKGPDGERVRWGSPEGQRLMELHHTRRGTTGLNRLEGGLDQSLEQVRSM